MVTECNEEHADFTPGLMFNQHTKAADYDCTSYLYEPGGSFRPLAQLKGRGVGSTVSYYVNDHIGTPQELLDEDGNVVWSAIYRAYGHVEMQAGIRQPLRFQGQYADEESGLHYNRYRYYNPLSGRYLTPDPISIRGGLNIYAYAINPLDYTDPLGLKCPDVKLGPDGEILSAKATVTPDDLGTGTGTHQGSRDKARSMGNDNDDAGHILGRVLGGQGGVDNVFPQLPAINRGVYRVFESKVKKYIEDNGAVDIEWKFDYGNGETRPTDIVYNVFQNGKLVLTREFGN